MSAITSISQVPRTSDTPSPEWKAVRQDGQPRKEVGIETIRQGESPDGPEKSGVRSQYVHKP